MCGVTWCLNVHPPPPFALLHTSLQIFILLCKTFDMLLFLLHRTCVQHAARQRQSMCRCVWETAGQPHDVSHTHSDQSHQSLVTLQRCHHHRIPRQRTWWVSGTLGPGSSTERQLGQCHGRGVVAEGGQASYYHRDTPPTWHTEACSRLWEKLIVKGLLWPPGLTAVTFLKHYQSISKTHGFPLSSDDSINAGKMFSGHFFQKWLFKCDHMSYEWNEASVDYLFRPLLRLPALFNKQLVWC